MLDMEYYPDIHENALQNQRNEHIPNEWMSYLQDSIGLWEALSKN
jgi:hypothetical protein